MIVITICLLVGYVRNLNIKKSFCNVFSFSFFFLKKGIAMSFLSHNLIFDFALCLCVVTLQVGKTYVKLPRSNGS